MKARSMLAVLVTALVACQSTTTDTSVGANAVDESNRSVITSSPTTATGQVSSEIPSEVMSRITDHATETFGVTLEQISVNRAEAVEWSDGSLGCPEEGMVYTQALVRGYWVELQVGDLVVDYRTPADGTVRLCMTNGVAPPSNLPPAGGERTEPPYSGDSSS